MSVLDEVYIFSSAGVPIAMFSKNNTKSLDENMLGCVISSIETFCHQMSGRRIKSFNVGDYKFTCEPSMEESIILVCKSSREIKDKQIKKICKVLSKIFEEMFEIEDLEKWNGDTHYFSKFRTKLDLYFRMGDL